MGPTIARSVDDGRRLIRSAWHAARTASAVVTLLGSLVVVGAEFVVRRGLRLVLGRVVRRHGRHRPPGGPTA